VPPFRECGDGLREDFAVDPVALDIQVVPSEIF
jgi:hypothetical protein